MGRPRVGLPSFTGKIERYAARFDLAELRPVDASLPAASTLRAWRKAVPPGFVFSVVLPRVVGELRPSPALDDALAKSLEVARHVEARCIVLATPPAVTPTELNKKRLAALVAKLPHDAVTLVWQPSGVWESDAAAQIARTLGLVVSVDAVYDDPPEGPVAYVRLRGLGESTRLGAGSIARVAATLADRREAFVVVETGSPAGVAKLLVEAASAPRRGASGAGRVISRARSRTSARGEEE